MNLVTLNKLMGENYLVYDQQFLKLILAAIIANRLPLKPVWLFIVGAPGSAKTEYLNTLSTCEGIVEVSSMTTASLVSGMQVKGKDPSLLSSLPERWGVIIFKDFTSILSLYNDMRAVIIGQLREIYDGKYNKPFGNGKVVRWQGKMGLVAAVTDAIYTEREKYAAMGDRFLIFQPEAARTREERIAVTKKSMSNVNSEFTRRRTELQESVKTYLDTELNALLSTYDKQGAPELPEKLIDEIATLAEFSSKARTGVNRDMYSRDKHITYTHDAEMPTRIAEQLTALGTGLMVINEFEDQARGAMNSIPFLTPDDKKLLYRIALDCMPPPRREVLKRLTMYYHASAFAIATDMGYSYATINHWLEDLNALKIINSIKHENGKTDWVLKTEYRAILAQYEGISELGNEMPAPEKEQDEPFSNDELPSF